MSLTIHVLVNLLHLSLMLIVRRDSILKLKRYARLNQAQSG